mmetsp:Transcript_16457/g.40209  ORF Transcript_16457/g.40209 Transcript_16457/m.40209 type:complete len:156 (-) Transcript_16457:1705-2172(-)
MRRADKKQTPKWTTFLQSWQKLVTAQMQNPNRMRNTAIPAEGLHMAGTVDLLREGVVVQDIFQVDLRDMDGIARMGNQTELHTPEAALREFLPVDLLQIMIVGGATATVHQGGHIEGAATLSGHPVADLVTQVVGLPERKSQIICQVVLLDQWML